METKIIDDMKVKRVNDEQYVVLPVDQDFFIGLDDEETPYEIVIAHNGEEWEVGARSFPTDNIDDIEYDQLESIDNPGLYLSCLPAIKKAFGDDNDIETYTPEKLDEIVHNAEWKKVPTGIEIKTGFVPKFIIGAEYDIEQFFHTLDLNAYDLPSNSGEFDIRVVGLIYFIPDNYKSTFVNKQKEFAALQLGD